jgi:hypothetical protein
LVKKFWEDELLKEMMRRGGLTKRQLECLIIQASGEKKEALNEKVSRITDRKMTKPAFVITRERAKKNVKAAFYTLIIVNYLSLVAPDCFLSFDKVALLLKEMQNKEITSEQVRAIIDILEGLITRILFV